MKKEELKRTERGLDLLTGREMPKWFEERRQGFRAREIARWGFG